MGTLHAHGLGRRAGRVQGRVWGLELEKSGWGWGMLRKSRQGGGGPGEGVNQPQWW